MMPDAGTKRRMLCNTWWYLHDMAIISSCRSLLGPRATFRKEPSVLLSKFTRQLLSCNKATVVVVSASAQSARLRLSHPPPVRTAWSRLES